MTDHEMIDIVDPPKKCSICWEEIDNSNRESFYEPPCKHVIHDKCAVENLMRNPASGNKCPECRQRMGLNFSRDETTVRIAPERPRIETRPIEERIRSIPPAPPLLSFGPTSTTTTNQSQPQQNQPTQSQPRTAQQTTRVPQVQSAASRREREIAAVRSSLDPQACEHVHYKKKIGRYGQCELPLNKRKYPQSKLCPKHLKMKLKAEAEENHPLLSTVESVSGTVSLSSQIEVDINEQYLRLMEDADREEQRRVTALSERTGIMTQVNQFLARYQRNA